MEQQPTAPPSAMNPGVSERPSTFGALWLCCGIGLLILFVFPRTLQWVSHATLGTAFNPFLMPDGTEVPYPKTPEFWADLGPTTLGFMLIVEGLSFLASHRRLLLIAAMILIGSLTLYNLAYAVRTLSSGFAIISGIAVLIGVPATIDLLKRVQRARFD